MEPTLINHVRTSWVHRWSGNRKDLTPTVGTILSGVQISQLSNAGKDQLALLAAQRKVLAFRDQDFASIPIEEALKYGNTVGVCTSTRQVVRLRGILKFTWYIEEWMIAPPRWYGTAEAYRRLSHGFRERLHGLKAVQSGIDQAESARARYSIVRREPVTSVHPLVRTHPATGEKALVVNPQFTRYIVGYKKEESDALLKFLYDYIAFGADFQARVKWAKGTVVVWDAIQQLWISLVSVGTLPASRPK
ncbi:MAG: hypothetical protein LQ341_005928 [Variospora aurantia]|nr:MAG: hypothetical protein LQ341_005928 [Variospora aurantia]